MVSTKDKEEYERAKQRYIRTQERINELSTKEKILLEQAKAVKFGSYDVSAGTIMRIANAYQNDYIDCLFIMFRLGFLKGMRKAKADIKKKAK